MGFKPGQGLGKKHQGIVSPIEANKVHGRSGIGRKLEFKPVSGKTSQQTSATSLPWYQNLRNSRQDTLYVRWVTGMIKKYWIII